jgi:SAM-dependent methyltransferase
MRDQMDLETKLKRTKEHWESAQVESLKDSNLRTLEINSIVSLLKRHATHGLHAALADFGCGDGFDTQIFSGYAAKTVGFDYSKEMLSRASQRQGGNFRFAHLDLISEDVQGSYDVAVTKRFIINLGDWSIQSRCIEKIANAVLPGGLFVMLECYKQGLQNLNRHRNMFGLPSLAEPYHNTYLDFDDTLLYLSRRFQVIETVDFSTYFYLTRCLSPRIAGEKVFDMDEQMRIVAESDDILQGSRIGPQLLVCLRKN